MEHSSELNNTDATRLTLHRIVSKNTSFESFSLTLESVQKPVSPTLELQVFANIYPQENNLHQAVLSLKIQAKQGADVIWRIQLEQAGFYTLEGFSEEQQKNILNGFCMNQIYSHAAPIVTQMVVQAGFAPTYLQPIDFYQLYQQEQRKKAIATSLSEMSDTSAPATPSADLLETFKQVDTALNAATSRTLN